MTEPSGGAVPSRRRRAARVVDAIALLLIVGGVAAWVYAQLGMNRLAAGRMRHATMGQGGGWNLTDWGNYDRMSRIGLGLAAAGIVLAIAAFAWVALRPPAPSDEQAHHS